MKIIAKYFIHFRDISGAEHDMTELINGDDVSAAQPGEFIHDLSQLLPEESVLSMLL